MPLSLLWCLCVGGEGQILLPWMHSSWTKPCWTLRFLSMQTANCSLWGSLLPLKVHKQTHTQRHTWFFLITFEDIVLTVAAFFEKAPKKHFYTVLFVSFLSFTSIKHFVTLKNQNHYVCDPNIYTNLILVIFLTIKSNLNILK